MSHGSSKKGAGKGERVVLVTEPHKGNAIEGKEIPFVLAPMANYSGNAKSAAEKGPLAERKFMEVDRNIPNRNLDAAVNAVAPKVSYQVRNTLSPERGKLNVNISFRCMNDFSPERVAEAVPATAELLKLRRMLINMRSELLARPDAKDAFLALCGNPDGAKESALLLTYSPEDGGTDQDTDASS